MKTVSDLIFLLLGITLGACSAAELPPACSAGLAPTSTVAPTLPLRLHNEFSGVAQVAFVISPSGQVQSPAIISADWRPVGRSSGQPVGYNEAVIAAVAQWRYPHRRQACRHQVPVEFQAGSVSATAGRSNNSFKPMPLRGTA
ncbi:hypothetical protein ACF3M1_15315 [Luteimonas sp. WGS1318]|uniref:hypothetical protein n=1 Tax=Luteimonas sp. WGS1318 TaxID=3366815 RepID=UPI00372CF98E